MECGRDPGGAEALGGTRMERPRRAKRHLCLPRRGAGAAWASGPMSPWAARTGAQDLERVTPVAGGHREEQRAQAFGEGRQRLLKLGGPHRGRRQPGPASPPGRPRLSASTRPLLHQGHSPPQLGPQLLVETGGAGGANQPEVRSAHAGGTVSWGSSAITSAPSGSGRVASSTDRVTSCCPAHQGSRREVVGVEGWQTPGHQRGSTSGPPADSV